MNPHRLCYGFAVSFPWVQLIAIVTLASLMFSKESKKIPWSAVSVLLVMFLLWTGLTTFFAVLPDLAWVRWQAFAKVLVMVFVTLIMVNTRERMHVLVWVIAISLSFYGIKGGVFTMLGGGGNRVYGPPGSFIADNNDLAMALCMIMPLMRYLQLHSRSRIVRIGLGVGLALTGVGVLGTYSRGGLIGLAVVGVALLVKSRRKLVVVLAVAVIGATAFQFMPPEWTARMDTLQDAKQTDSGETRIQSWKFAANVAIHRPLTGGGFDDYLSEPLWSAYAPEGSIQRAIHSIYFRTLGEHGFVGLLLFLGLLFTTWRNCAKVRKRTRGDPEQSWAFDLASMLQVSFIAFMASGAFLPMPYFDLSYQLMALSAVLASVSLKGVVVERPESHALLGGARVPATGARNRAAREPTHG
ncbi:putative O-glycosylation ligase, exosortase A system-associated [Rhodanobacter lindaniclasticus]